MYGKEVPTHMFSDRTGLAKRPFCDRERAVKICVFKIFQVYKHRVYHLEKLEEGKWCPASVASTSQLS